MDYKAAYALLVETISNTIVVIFKTHNPSREREKVLELLKTGLEEAEDIFIGMEE